MVLTFHVPIFEIFLEDKKGIGDVASLRLSLHGVILSPGGPPSPKFSRVPLVDVFVTIYFFYGKGLLALCPTLLFSQPGLGPSMAELLIRSGWMDTLSRSGWMDAISRGVLMDALSRGG